MWILGLDLAWTGTTGWAIFDTETENFVDWGDFKPKKTVASERSMSMYLKSKYLLAGLFTIFDKWALSKFDLLAYEEPDFYNVDSPIRESVVAASLSMAALTVVNFWLGEGRDSVAMGANHSRMAFEAKDKQEAAMLLAMEFPAFKFKKHNQGYLWHKSKKLSHHTSDAMMIAYVAGKEAHLQNLIERSNA